MWFFVADFGLLWLVGDNILVNGFIFKEKAKELLGSKRLAVAAPFIGNTTFWFSFVLFFLVNLMFGAVKEGRQNNLFLTIQKHLI